MVPGYKKIKDISQGPLTSVILARQESLDRNVLLKILHPQHAQDKEIVERFIREAKLYAKLKHDNIVNVIDLGKQNGSYYIAMEYVDGYSLDTFIKKYAPIPFEMGMYIIIEVVTGLHFAHESGIIHRDIKPSNILVGKNGDIKITDFGLARPLNLSAITEQGNILGTPSYMAPELARSESASTLSDIFGLGASFYELFNNESLFTGESVAETISNILNKKPKALSKIRTDIPTWISELILKMLEKKPQRRPESCSKIVEEIKNNENIISKEKFYRYINDNIKENSQELNNDEKKSKSKLTILYIPIAATIIIFIFFFTQIFLKSKNSLDQVDPSQNVVTPNNQIVNDSTIYNTKAEPEIKKQELTKDQTKKKANIIAKEKNIIENNISEKKASIEIKEKGSLFINAIPWAEIYINKKKIDTTPLLKPLDLKSGLYELELKNPDFISYKSPINIQAGQHDSINVKLEQAFGNLKLTVLPWGKIYINNKYIDTSPIMQPIKLKTGKNELNIVNPNFAKHTEVVNIRSGETLEKTIYLSN